MAGAGYKLFNTGDVLLASEVNTYLQQQTVMVFASSAARTTALSGVLAEGMMSYLQDTNSVEVYNGSSWVNVGNAGDITGVTAGTGISGGGTTGDVTITNSMATAIDAKGDLIVGTGADTFSRLAVGGTDGHVLKVKASTSTGLEWGAASSSATFSGCLLHNNDAFQNVANNTWTALTFSTELFDTDGYHSTTTNTSRITIPSGKDGYHLFYAGGFVFGGASGSQGIEFYKNGARIISGQALSAVITNITSGARPTAIFALNLVATDYVEVRAIQQSGSAQDTSGNQFFGNVFLGV